MKLRSLAGFVGAAVIAATVLAAPTSATAAQAVFPNPAATGDTTDFDVASADIKHTDAAVTVKFTTQNYSGPAFGGSFYLVDKSMPDANVNAYVVDADSAAGEPAVYDADSYTGGASSPSSSEGVQVNRDAASGVFTLVVPTARLTWSGPIYVLAFLYDQNDTALFAASPGTPSAVGPVARGAAATATTVTLTSPTQVYGSTPATVLATVTPATAVGTIQLLEGATIVASSPAANGFAALTLPQSAASGAHVYVARFVPTDAENFAPSSSVAFAFSVISAAKTTKTTVTLSKKSQTFKKKSTAKVKVVVSEKAVGTVAIFDGKKKLKTVTLKNGKASYTLSKSLKKGAHKIKAVFTPSNVEAFTASTSKVVKLTVKK